ncbi:hypothetical protein H6P81_019698 [Aristolochia fimbriata]|uniref:Cupin type-1 domain-containing protein n=1 Tax=Aristolochia fimbriata TaxID=158543 RepID=A0AAV7DX27_ARIFI|nr:hypothetical protein H6P81_019698 [Aristolochia fimbriata]
MAARSNIIVLFAILCLSSSLSFAYDPNPLQDLCVADLNTTVLVNGFVCKDPKEVTAADFFFSGLDKVRIPTNAVGSTVTPVNVMQIPGLNTMGISLVRIDYAPYGQNPPHTHPRGTEILTVLEGSLFVGFVTSNPDNRLISKLLHKGDVFVFPIGLIHFQVNVGKTNAVAIAGLSSQNPGVITIADAVFGSDPKISPEILARAFQVDGKVIEDIQSNGTTTLLLVLSLLGTASLTALASDPAPLFDFCVADVNNPVVFNGFACKDPKHVKDDDFYFTGLAKAGDPSNPLGLAATPVGVTQVPGLNTLGLSLVRFDLAPAGLNPPHTHPRASEVLTVLEGSIYAGFVTSFPEFRLVSKVLEKGDVFVFPVGLVHFLINVGKNGSNAVAWAALNSQNPGLIPVGNTVFGSKPPISSDVLAKSFQVDTKIIDLIKSKLS